MMEHGTPSHVKFKHCNQWHEAKKLKSSRNSNHF
jgi:hypothetical protein